MSRPARLRGDFAVESLEDRVNPVSFANGDWATVGGNAASIAFGNINGDGAVDMAVGTGETGVEIFTNDGTGDFTRTTTLTGMGFPAQMELADLNGDGFADVLTGNDQQVAIVLNNGDGTFGGPIVKNIGIHVGDIFPADFNGDGKLDVVAAIPGGVAILLNNGSASVLGDAAILHSSSDLDASWVAAGDFNGDAKPDFAVSLKALQRVDVYLNNGAGQFTRTQYANPVANDSGDVVTGDFNNDGHLDILVNYFLTGMVGLMRGNGDGTFQNATITNTSTPRGGPLATADFDRDGNLDLLFMQEPGQNDMVLPGKGNGTFALAVPANVGFAGDVAVADVNGDGLPDIGTSQALSPGYVNLSINTTPVDLYFTTTAPSTTTAGDSFSVTVTARGPNGAVLTDYEGTVHFASTDAQADLPDDYQFTPADNGTKTFTVTLKTAGERSITITDLASAPAYGQVSVSVHAAAATSFELAAPGLATVGRHFPVTVTAFDAFGNVAAGYDGVVHFTSTDTAAVLPADFTLSIGVGTVYVALATEGTWAIMAADTSAGISADSDPITVNPIILPPIVADFGTHGLRRWTEADGWVTISKLNAESLTVSADATTVVADFGTRGLKRWTEADGWHALTTANVLKVDVSSDGGTVVASFGLGILKRWTEADGWVKLSKSIVQKFFLSDDGTTLLADFGAHGLQRWTEAGGWVLIDGPDPGKMVVSADGNALAANFSNGLWYWVEGVGWTGLTAWHPQTLTISADGATVFASFTQNGLWSWTKADGWTQLSQFLPESLSASSDGQRLAADFGKNGLGLWTQGEGWVQLAKTNAQNVLISRDGNSVLGDFGLHGLQNYGIAWATLTGLDAEQIVLSEPAT